MEMSRLNLTKKQKNFVKIALGLIAVVPLAYIVNFFSHPISDKSADWGTFGDFIGGILNPIIGLLTLFVTIIIAVTVSIIEKRYHDEIVNSPVKPYLIINGEIFFSSDITGVGITVEQDFYSYTPPENPTIHNDHFEKQFPLRIANKGLGAAAEVLATFQIDLEEVKQLFTLTHQRITITPTDIKTDGDGRRYLWLQVDSEDYNYKGVIKIWEVEKAGLGIIEKGTVVELKVPGQIIKAFKLYNLIRRLNVPVNDFPPFLVSLDHKNIHGKTLASEFRIGFFPLQDNARFSEFRLLQERI